jgi:hypothetical protein
MAKECADRLEGHFEVEIKEKRKKRVAQVSGTSFLIVITFCLQADQCNVTSFHAVGHDGAGAGGEADD